ncbi:MAG TPA: hypothetical protein VLG50_07950 [Candidatus Saccharimonadales bacterium]|nr:hypothetical protein [Candidatus Saccharimonadales bacterium]
MSSNHSNSHKKIIKMITTSGNLDKQYQDHIIDASNNHINLTLPQIHASGKHFHITRSDTTLNGVILIAQQGNTINGSASIAMLPNTKYYIVSYNTNYYLL